MIKYKYFKYIFFRYCIYNLLYGIIFIFIPILFYTILVLHISLNIKNNDIVNLNEIITPGFNNLKDYTVLFQYSNNTDNILIIVFFILFIIGYIYVNNMIINKLFFKKYKKITIFMKKQSYYLCDIMLFSVIEFLFVFPGSICIFLWNELFYQNYIKYFYMLQFANYLLSWLLTYFWLNKFVEYYTRIRFKILKM